MHTQSWLWPDHVIGKRESGALREEHNRLVNCNANMLEALHKAVDVLSVCAEMAEIDGDNTFWNKTGPGYDACMAVNLAIAKAEGREP